MKHLYLILLVIAVLPLQAQTIYPVETYFEHNDEDNAYFKDVNLIFNKFLGEWEYSSATEYFKIRFFKVVKEREAARVLTIVRFRDMIKSHLLYRKKINGVWTDIYNTFPIPGQSSGKIHISGSRPENFATMELDYREPYSGNCPNYRSGELILAFLVTSEGPKLQWTRTEWTKSSLFFDEPCPDGTPRDASEFKIPAEMILTKVN